MKTVKDLKQTLANVELLNEKQMQDVKGGQCDKRRRVTVSTGSYSSTVIVP